MKRIGGILLALAALTPNWLAACPACKDSIATSDTAAPAHLSAGFNTSIYLMLGCFLAVTIFLSLHFVRAVRMESR